MSASAFFRPARDSLLLKFRRSTRMSDASLVRASRSIFVDVRGLGPSTGANSSAPMPRVPV
jgi:hypothetical protein